MTRPTMILPLALALALAAAPGQAAQLQPSSDLLLPYFEVDLDPAGVTTLFAVGNATSRPVDVLATLQTNWGIPILEVAFTLQPDEIRTVNLRDWLRDGGDPKKSLASLELAHLAAAASGQPSPKDRLYYSSEVRPGRAVGSVVLRTRGSRPDALWGDWFVVDTAGSLARGDVLVDIARSASHRGLCRRHLLRYLSGGGFDGGTELVIWRESAARPSASPGEPASGSRLAAEAAALSEPGVAVESRQLALLAVEKVTVADLGLQEAFGALRIETEDETFIGVQHTAGDRYSVALQAYCLQDSCQEGEASLALEVLLDGKPAGAPPGLLVENGRELAWTLVVANTGRAPVSEIQVEGLPALCPRSELAAGEVMVCTAASTALGDRQTVPVTATGRSSCAGVSASVSATGHYEGAVVDVYTVPVISIVTLVNGDDANLPPGPSVPVGTPVLWTWLVTNPGDADLHNVQVADDQGLAVACPKAWLSAGETMICTGTGVAQAGERAHLATATGTALTGETAAASDPGYYLGVTP